MYFHNKIYLEKMEERLQEWCYTEGNSQVNDESISIVQCVYVFLCSSKNFMKFSRKLHHMSLISFRNANQDYNAVQRTFLHNKTWSKKIYPWPPDKGNICRAGERPGCFHWHWLPKCLLHHHTHFYFQSPPSYSLQDFQVVTSCQEIGWGRRNQPPKALGWVDLVRWAQSRRSCKQHEHVFLVQQSGLSLPVAVFVFTIENKKPYSIQPFVVKYRKTVRIVPQSSIEP